MAKFGIDATKIINYYVEVEAENEFDAREIVDSFIVDDFEQVGTEFIVDYVYEKEVSNG
jgi:hypothetical protein